MATTDKYYVGDCGTAIIVDTGTDISTATETKLSIKKPDGSSVLWVGIVYNTNYVKYITTEGDFNIPGVYFLQSYVKMPSGCWYGNTVRFVVSARFQ